MIGFLVVGLLILVVATVIISYNKLVSAKNSYLNAFSQIDVQLTRRHDLIPNLVETTKAYLHHENETLVSVIQARNGAEQVLQRLRQHTNSEIFNQLNQQESLLSRSLNALQVQLEAYPDLKANQTIQSLLEEISSTENRIAFARQAYNDAVMFYNTVRQSFPVILFADSIGHKKDAVLLNFDASDIHQTPKISW